MNKFLKILVINFMLLSAFEMAAAPEAVETVEKLFDKYETNPQRVQLVVNELLSLWPSFTAEQRYAHASSFVSKATSIYIPNYQSSKNTCEQLSSNETKLGAYLGQLGYSISQQPTQVQAPSVIQIQPFAPAPMQGQQAPIQFPIMR